MMISQLYMLHSVE